MYEPASWQATVTQTGLRAAVALRGPGRLGRDGAPGVMIFDAGAQSRARDMVERFFAEEIDALLWLEDYLQDSDMLDLMALEEGASTGGEDEAPEDIEVQKSVLNQAGTDWGDSA